MPANKESKRERERERERELACWIKLTGLLKRKGRQEKVRDDKFYRFPDVLPADIHASPSSKGG